jgi:UDP-N-acetylmuramoyl-L-alanyl-D-glutamate--2,6-diaminopimelate ligase
MEVSSHALVQGRLTGTNFDTAIFTNLSQDHLDYHGNMQDYFAAKSTLFTKFEPRNTIINLDDKYAEPLLKQISYQTRLLTYSLDNPTADVYFEKNKIYTPWGVGILRSPLIGRFNVSNILACIACCGIQGLSLDVILNAVANLIPVPGRMQKVATINKNAPMVVIDYAHTPDALIKALHALREYKDRVIHCVFGCGGDRDRSKRPLMLQAVIENSDKIIITQDNPRTEDPQQIVRDMLANHASTNNISIELDRAVAITKTIQNAGPNDIILIAGKGHEDYQIIGTEKLPFSDLLVAQQALEVRSEVHG